MLRAISSIYIEGQALELLSSARRDVFRLFRRGAGAVGGAPTPVSPTVLTSRGGEQAASPPPPSVPRDVPPPPPPPPRYAWHAVATTLAVTASLGGAYYYRKLNEDRALPAPPSSPGEQPAAPWDDEVPPPPVPISGDLLPRHVQYLLVGAGTASFAAMRAIRSARPDAHVLMVGEEPELPYMRPPLSKELWREPELAERVEPDSLTFRQWNGRRRALAYEPPAFYTPVEGDASGGASVARGWRVERVDVVRHEAYLVAPGAAPVTLTYDKCLLAPGLRPRRAPALRAAAAAGRSMPLRTVRDAARLARQLRRDDVRRVLVLGGGFLATELSAALAERLAGSGRAVLQLYREALPLAAVLPAYLAEEAARRLSDAGVTLLPEADVVSSRVEESGSVRLQLSGGGELAADLVLECVGAAPDEELARRSQLETHPALGGVLVNAELQARHDVYAAGDVACFYDVVLGRRRVEHHDHAVVSGRLAGENMAALGPPKHYAHQSMFWSDLGPQLGYEAIGIVDSRLPTVGVFSADAVSPAAKPLEAAASPDAARSTLQDAAPVPQGVAPDTQGTAPERHVAAPEAGEAARRYERGVVFYLRDKRVVGVLLWNLFNRMHVARQVLAHGEFEDLLEVAKLFSLHEDE